MERSGRPIAFPPTIRVGHIDLDREPLDLDRLGRFLLNLHVFIVGDDRGLAAAVLSSFGYGLLGGVKFSNNGLNRIGNGSPMSDDMLDQLNYGAARGWLLVILSQAMADSENFWRELPKPSAQERVMIVLPMATALPKSAPEIPSG